MPEQPRDPMRAAQANMRPPALGASTSASRSSRPRAAASRCSSTAGGARTPGKRPLIAPTRAVAELIAAEWAAQGETIEPMSMPATRLANSAIDGVADALGATRAEIARYAGADLLCYRAEAPEALVAAEAEAFDPVLDWAGQRSARISSRRAWRMSPAGGRSPRRARRSRLRRAFRPGRAACDDEPDRLGRARVAAAGA